VLNGKSGPIADDFLFKPIIYSGFTNADLRSLSFGFD
jgi:hypothetical protein